MRVNDPILVAVSNHQIADDFFKKLKQSVNPLINKHLLLMRALLPDNNKIMMQTYPELYVFDNLSVNDIPEVVASLLEHKESLLSQNKKLFLGDLSYFLRANVKSTELNICGKCYPCRLGGPLINELLEHYQEKSSINFSVIKENLINIGITMKNASMCAVGLFGADPLLFAIKEWPDYFLQTEEKINHG